MRPICRNCSAPIPLGAPSGHCPSCLLLVGLAVGGGWEVDEEPSSSRGDRLPARSRRLGDYELLEEIGRGGMGIVYRARHIALDRWVALKVVRAGEFADEGEVARFRAEAESAARLDHPNIVPIFETGEDEGRHFFSMKIVEGGSLADDDRWRKYSPESSHEMAQVMMAVARAVHYAHQRGILHRDLKPQNTLLDANGQPLVTDFGLAKRMDSDRSLTQSGAIVGTPSYIAPEQAGGAQQLTTAADVYGLGAILYELLAGAPPFRGATVLEILQRVLHDRPESPWLARRRRLSSATAGCDVGGSNFGARPSDQDIICLKCLEKEPERRYASAEALADDLQRWLLQEPIHARPTGRGERILKWILREPIIAGLVGGLILLFALGLGGVLWQWREATLARKQLKAELWQSHATRARAERFTTTVGRRERALSDVRAAVALGSSRELRDEAAADLALSDLRLTDVWCPHQMEWGFPDWAMDPQRAYFAVTATDAVELWHIPTRTRAARLSHEERNTHYLRFSRDGESLAVRYFNRDFAVWNVAQRRLRFAQRLGKAPDGDDPFYGFDFSADGRISGTVDQAGIFRLYDAATGHELRTLRLADGPRAIQMARFNPRSDAVALAAGNVIEVWSVTGKLLAQRTNLVNATRLAWHPRGDVLAYVNWFAPDIHLWNTRTDEEHVIRSGHGSQMYLSFAPQGDLLATRGLDQVTRLWDLAREQVVVSDEAGASLDFDAAGTHLAFDRQGDGIGLWEVVRSTVYRSLRHEQAASGVAFQAIFEADGRHLFWRAADGLYRVELKTGQIERGPPGWSMWIAESTHGMWAADFSGVTHWSNLWQTTSPQKSALPASGEWRWIGVDPQQRFLILADDSKVQWVQWPEGRTIGSVATKSAQAWAMSSDAKWLAVAHFAAEDRVTIYDASSREEVAHLDVAASNLTFDPQGRWLVTGGVGGCRFFDVSDWREKRRIARHTATGLLLPMAFTPDGRCFAYARTPAVVELVEVETERTLVSLEAPDHLQVRGLTFSQDGTQLAAPSEGGVVQLWDLARLRTELRLLNLDWPERATPLHVPSAQPLTTNLLPAKLSL